MLSEPPRWPERAQIARSRAGAANTERQLWRGNLAGFSVRRDRDGGGPDDVVCVDLLVGSVRPGDGLIEVEQVGGIGVRCLWAVQPTQSILGIGPDVEC